MVTKVDATTPGTPRLVHVQYQWPLLLLLSSRPLRCPEDDLWVASRSGANSKTPAAATGSLTEMLITTGALVMTVPVPTTASAG